MVKILQNKWKLIVTTILCIYWCGDAGEASANIWRVVRRFLERGGNDTQHTSFKPQQEEDVVKRARLRQRGLMEYRGSHHSTDKSLSKQNTKEAEKPKHRFLIEKPPGTSKYHSHKSHNHIDHNGDNDTELRGTSPYLEPIDDPVEPKKKFKTESKPNQIEAKAEQLREDQDIGQKVNERNQSVDPKLSVRAGRYRDSNENVGMKKNRFRKPTTVRITKMHPAYQLQEDENILGKNKCYGKERLNPYAINEQMLRYMDTHSGNMNITMEVIGRTAEYNNIVLLKITEIRKEKDSYFRVHKYADDAPEKKIIFIVQGLAVRGMGVLMDSEITFATIMSFYAAHLSNFDIFVIPIGNPDGFTAVLNAHHGKFWNKNMSPQSSCAGVMLDRNFDVEWNASHGISPCSHFYPGPAPFSEPETRAVRDVLHLYSQKIIAYIHVHASTYDTSIFKGDAILFPRGYTNVQNDDDKYMDIKGELEESMKNATFRVISVAVESLYSWYGKVVGASVDYASSVYGIPYAMEFCMQVYERIEQDALYHIWRRNIDVVFRNIWKSVRKGGNND